MYMRNTYLPATHCRMIPHTITARMYEVITIIRVNWNRENSLRPSETRLVFTAAHLRASENTHAHALEGKRGDLGIRAGLSGRCREKGRVQERREPRYLTDNVIIVSQCTGMRDVRRGVAQFPYIWVGALSDGGQREIIIVLLRRWPVLTAGGGGGGGKVESK